MMPILTLDLPEPMLQRLGALADREGRSVEELALTYLAALAETGTSATVQSRVESAAYSPEPIVGSSSLNADLLDEIVAEAYAMRPRLSFRASDEVDT